MRFFINRSTTNFPYLYSIGQNYINSIDLKYCVNYKIIPFGDYCLPRLITSLNRLKPTKKYGEESFPFDLCFSKFTSNLKLLTTNFKDFYNNIEYNQEKKYFENIEFNLFFNHDDISILEFKERYQKRIDNLYKAISNEKLHIYFIVATFEEISSLTIEQFINEMNHYRDINAYDLIIINQSSKKLLFSFKNVHIIDLTKDLSFGKINKNGLWVEELKKMKNINAIIFNYKVMSKLSKLIK